MPGAPPPRIIFTRGRRRQVDATGHFCPHVTCSYHGRVGFGNIRANGHPNGRRWRQLVCLGCHRYFLETVGTPFHAKQVDPDKLVWAIAALAEGLGIRAVARVFETDPNTVLGWLAEAAEHLEAFSRYFLRDVYVGQVQMDELFALLSAVKVGEVTEAEAIKQRVVFGARATIELILAKRGWKINTSFIERLNLDFRQHVAAIGRRVNTLCKHEAGLRQQLAIFHVYHNFVLPHASLRLPLADPLERIESGKRWRQQTPAMAAGLTDHIWSLREIMLFRVPPWPQPQIG